MEISVCTLFFRLVNASVLLSVLFEAQNDDPFSIRVESNLVLIHAEVSVQARLLHHWPNGKNRYHPRLPIGPTRL